MDVMSAGLAAESESILDREAIDWADSIFVMERVQKRKIQDKFRNELGSKRVVCLDIPDRYRFMDKELIQILESKMQRWLPDSAR